MDHVTATELDGFDDREVFRKMYYEDLVGCGRFDEDVETFRRRLEALALDEATREATGIGEQFFTTLDRVTDRLRALQQADDEERILEEEHGLVLELYVVVRLGPLVERFCTEALDQRAASIQAALPPADAKIYRADTEETTA